MKLGAQLYTVRDFCNTPADVAETLKKVADIGYESVQLSGVCELDPAWFRHELEKNGLSCPLSHTKPLRLLNELDRVIEEHNVFGGRYIGLGMFEFDESADGQRYEDFRRLYHPVMQKIKDAGYSFQYHNHNIEFQHIDGKCILEKLAGDFTADEMGFILDTYWVQVSGGDPASWIRRLKGRVPTLHLKDCDFERKYMPVGEGNMDFDAILSSAEDAGTEYLFVEQDDCYGEDPFGCLERSFRNLKALGV